MYPLLPRSVMLSSLFRRDQSGHPPMYLPFSMLIESVFSLVRPVSACSVTHGKHAACHFALCHCAQARLTLQSYKVRHQSSSQALMARKRLCNWHRHA